MTSTVPLPDHVRSFFDPSKLNEWIKENVVSSLNTSLNKIESNNFKLQVKDVKMDDKKFSIKQQKEAILRKEDLTIPVKGTVELIDKRNDKVVESKKATLANVPFITQRNTAIYRGSEYIGINQSRLKPGIYTRVRESGEAEGHINVKPGTGFGGKLIFDPEKATFLYMVGSTSIHLYSLLHDFGVPDSAFEQAWGKDILLKNKSGYKSETIDKLYDKLFTY